jgi:hypothetical protein
MRARHALATLVVGLALPERAAACAVCLGNAFGDRSYAWPYLGLILMPFIVAGAILGALAWQFGWRPRDAMARISSALHTEGATPPRTPRRHAAPADPSPRTHTETT